jgi:hypothetical protein
MFIFPAALVSYVGEHETDSGDESSEESEVEEEEMVVSTCSVFIKNESGGVTVVRQ